MNKEYILAIDPGNEQSGYVIYRRDGAITAKGILPNDEILNLVRTSGEMVAVEMIASYGMAVGKSVFDTCRFIGRIEAVYEPNKVILAYRKDVKVHLCGTTRATDSNIRQAIMDRYYASGSEVVGTKAHPGPLYGIKSHMWAALAVALYVADTTEVPK